MCRGHRAEEHAWGFEQLRPGPRPGWARSAPHESGPAGEKSPWRPVIWSVALGLTLRDAGDLQPPGLNLLSQPTWGIFKELLVTGLGTNSSHHVRCIINSGHQHYPDFLISGSESLRILNKKPRMRICLTKLISLTQFTNILLIS